MSAEIHTRENSRRLSVTPGLGRFGRMFELPPQGEEIDDATLQGWLTSLGEALVDQEDGSGLPLPSGDHPTITAGYTYLGQFIDHDLTLEPTRLPSTEIDISTLSNFRSPALDLDCLLGFGPSVTPHLYEARTAGARAGMLRTANSDTGTPEAVANDLPRLGNGVPLIGDPRNDENLAVGQFHTAMITFYNKIFVDLAAGMISDVGPAGAGTAEKAARLARWHYQWIVLHDFVARLVDPAVLQKVLAYGPQHYRPTLGNAYMPVEFAGAAYRLGHTMVRQRYHVNGFFQNASLSDLFKFSSSGGSVLPVPSNWFVNWNRFFSIDAATTAQPARRLDPYSASGLQNLPGVPPPASLPARNLVRGWTWGLPSGQDIAAHLGVNPLTAQEILDDPNGNPWPERGVVEPFNFHNDSPLWYYILKEAQVRQQGDRLGEVGSVIVAEVFVGLLQADPESFLNVEPNWKPTLPTASAGSFSMPDLFRYLPAGAINPVGGDTSIL